MLLRESADSCAVHMHTGYVYLSKLTKDKEREGNKFVKDATMFRLSYTQSVTG